jgi:hypothetical protein
VKLARKFSFGDADHAHVSMIAVLPPLCPACLELECR